MQPLLARIGIDSAAFETGMARVRALAESAGVAVSRSFSDAGTKFTRLTGQIKEHEQQLRSLGMTLGAVGASLSAVAALGTRAAIAQESAFAGIRKTVDATEAEFRQLKAALTDLSNRLPVPYTDLARIGELAGQLGVSGVENITRFVEVMARIVPASNLTVEAASTGFAKLANIMQEPIRNVDRMAAVVVELGIKGVTSEAQILEFAERLGVAGKIAGLTTANVLSLSSAMASVGVEAEAGGTAGTKMLIALSQAVSTANEKLAIFAELAAIAPAEFQKLFRTDPMEAFVRVIEGLGKAGEGAFQFLNDLMGNEIRLTRVTLGLGNAVGLLRTDVARGTQQWKENAALMRVSEERFKTTESALLTLRSAVSNLAASFGEHLLPLLRAVAEPTRAIAIGFQGLADPLKFTVAILGVGVAGSLTLTGGFLLFLSFVPRIVEGLKLINIGFGALALTAGPLTALMLGAAAAIGVFRMAADEFGKTDRQLAKVQQQLAGAREQLDLLGGTDPALESRIEQLEQMAAGLEAILKFDADAQARGAYQRTLKAPQVATEDTTRATKEQIEAFQGLQRQVAALALSPVDRKFAEIRARLAETTKELGPLRVAGEALVDTLVRMGREEDLAALKLQPLAEEAKKLEERLGVWSDILAPLDLTLRGVGSEVEELGSTLNANADTFNTWGIRAAEAEGFLGKLAITTGFLETVVAATAEPMDAFEAQLFALAEAATEAKEAQSKLAVEMTQKVMDSMNRLRDEAEAFGKTGVEADKARLSRDLLRESYAALNPAQKTWIDQLAGEKTALEQARIASDLYLSGLTKLDAERAAGAAAGIKEQQGRLQTTLTTLQTINEAEKETGLLRSRIAQEQMKAQGDFYGFIGESLRQMVLETQDAWRDIDAMVRGVAQSMQRSLSDLFFNVLTGQVNSLKDVFKNLWQAIIRQITDFLASAAVRALLQFAASAFGFGGGGGGGGLGTAVASGAIQLAVDQTTGNLVAVGGGGGGTAAGSWFGAGQNMSMGASLAGSFPGIANIAGNWAAGGLSGALFGLPAGVSFGEGAIELGAGIGAFGGSLTEATAGVAGFGGSISSLAGPLAALGIALNLGSAIFGGDPTGPGAIGTYGGTLVGAGAGALIGSIVPGIGTIIGALIGGALGGSAGGFLGGLFGGPELTHAQREALETNRILGAAGGAQEDILGARTYRQLYERLISYSSGYVGGTSSVALSPYIADVPSGLSQDVFRQMVASGGVRLPSGFADIEDFMARNPWTGAGGGWGPGAALPVFTGNQNAYYPTVTYEGFREIARQHPDWLGFNIQAGVTPGNLTAGNAALTESTQALIEQMNEVQDQIDEILDDLFRELVELDGAADPTADAIAAFREGLTELTEAAQENIDRQRIAMLDLTDPKAILEQTARIRDLIHQRYEGEIELIENFTASVQKAADGWRRIGDAVRAQVDQMRLGPFGPTNPSLALAQTTEAFDTALAAFQADRTLETADAVARAIDPLLTAASQMFARPSTEFRAIFDRTTDALEEIGGYADEQAQTLEETIAEILGEGVTLEQLTADNTAAMRDELVALRQDVLHMLGEIGYGDETAISELTQSLLDANTPAAIAQAAQLSEAQRQTVLLAIIAQNTMPTATAAAALVQTPWGEVTPENARALYQSYGPVPSYQSGTEYVPRTGLAVLHEGERVTPAWAAGGGVTISIGDINVSGAADPRTTADEIVETIERRLREPGRLRTAVRAVARSA